MADWQANDMIPRRSTKVETQIVGTENKDRLHGFGTEIEILENDSDDFTSTCNQNTEEVGCVRISLSKHGTGVRTSSRKCTMDVRLTAVSGLMIAVGLCLHLYGFSSSYWRIEQNSGNHFGLWLYCNNTCFHINSSNSWYYGVQACAVMGLVWSITSGILSVHGLIKINKTSYVLSIFFFFWACMCVLATTVLFGYKELDGHAISSSFGFYVGGNILQFTSVTVSVVNVGLLATFRMITCTTKGREKHDHLGDHNDDNKALLTSES